MKKLFFIAWIAAAICFIGGPVFVGCSFITRSSLVVTSTATNAPAIPFTTDGCSDCGLSEMFRHFDVTLPARLEAICIEHDRAYWKGGTEAERLAADEKMRDAIKAAGYPEIAEVYFYAVRAGGVGWLPTSFRWGYGDKFQLFK